MNEDEIRIGTRGSALALAQARLVAARLERDGRRTRLVLVETEGDRRQPDTVWGEGAFVAAIEHALLEGRVDVAVHSAKDLPTGQSERLRIAAYLERSDPRDALVARPGEAARLDELPHGSRVGTDSPRRTGFLRARRPDLVVHALHGNVDTRIRRLDAGETDVLVLASAGLERLELADRIGERLEPELVPPAPGQGAIAVQVRADDAQTIDIVGAIDHGPTRDAVEAERAFLAASGGGCRAPIGALAKVRGDELDLMGGYAKPDGSEAIVARRRGPRTAGSRLALELTAELGSRRATPPRSPNRVAPWRILVTRSAGQVGGLELALRAAGLEPVSVPTIEVEVVSGADLDAVARFLPRYRWVVVTSANGARAILRAAEHALTTLETSRFAAIGPATARFLQDEGIEVRYQPPEASASAMAAGLPIDPGDRVAVVRGDLANEELPLRLRARGAVVDDVIGYRTREAPAGSRRLLRHALAEGPLDGVIFTSGSTVRGLAALASAETIEVRSIPAICIGPETAAEAQRAGFSVLAVAPAREAAVLAQATAEALAQENRNQ